MRRSILVMLALLWTAAPARAQYDQYFTIEGAGTFFSRSFSRATFYIPSVYPGYDAPNGAYIAYPFDPLSGRVRLDGIGTYALKTGLFLLSNAFYINFIELGIWTHRYDGTGPPGSVEFVVYDDPLYCSRYLGPTNLCEYNFDRSIPPHTTPAAYVNGNIIFTAFVNGSTGSLHVNSVTSVTFYSLPADPNAFPLEPNAVAPEPAAMTLLGTGLLGLAWAGRRRRRRG